MKEFQNLRNKLDSILDDYEHMEKEYPILCKVHTTYLMMTDLLKEMKSMGDLDGYDVIDIFERIEKHEKEGY